MINVLYDHQIHVAQKFGGISRYFDELTNTSPSDIGIHKISPDQVYPSGTSHQSSSFLSKGVRSVKKRLPHFLRPATGDTAQERLYKIINSTEYDIFHPTYYDPYFLELNKKPFVLTVYDMIHELYKEYFEVADNTIHQKKVLCSEADHIIAISQKTKDDLIQLFKVPEEKVTVIHLASSFHPSIAKKPALPDTVKKFILFTGSRAIYKNFYFPLLALSELLKADKDLHLVCSGHPFKPHEIQLFKDFGIEQKVHQVFLKDDAELSWAYSNAALFIFPSLYEGFGFPILEAFACKCPVISSNGGSLPEVAGNAALYFEPKNYVDIQQVASNVLYNTEVRENLVQRGLQRLNSFSWEKCRSETFDVYRKILK